jgi:segregation and condensation protein A
VTRERRATSGDAAQATLEIGVEPAEPTGFEVHLSNFEGPFDLLLNLIAKHKLDVTEVALSQVTNEFVEFVRAIDWDLDETSEFLVVAATLLDLKAARLLPSADVEDEDDLALLEARDLLFARLLQYKAYKEVAAFMATTFDQQSAKFPRTAGLEERYLGLLPEIVLDISPEDFAKLAANALTPKEPPTVSVSHLHHARISVAEQASHLAQRLSSLGQATFRHLTGDCDSTLLVVARFLALLELFRERVVAFEQVAPLGELTVRWTGKDEGGLVTVSTEFDEPDLTNMPALEGDTR